MSLELKLKLKQVGDIMILKKTLIATSIASCIFCVVTPYVSAAEEVTKDEFEVISVTGLRGSAIKSIFNKREAGSVMESISSVDIGKLPDVTIADSLQRITGVQIVRSAGEGSRVNIRGLSQVSTLLNGEQFISAGSITGLQPDFSDIPSELLSGVNVYKSAEASLMSGGISGTIDLGTRRPLALDEGWTVLGSAEVGSGSYTDDNSNKFSLFSGYHNDDFGAVVTLTQSETTLANYRYGMYDDFVYQGQHRDYDGDGNTDALFTNVNYGITNKTAERERLGGSASFQYIVNDYVELIADVFYTEMESNDLANGLVVDNAWTQWDWVDPAPDSLVNRGKGAVAEGHEGEDFFTSNVVNLSAPRVLSKGQTTHSDRDSLNLNLQANVNFSDNFSGSFRYIHGEASASNIGNAADAYVTSGAQHNLKDRVGNVRNDVNPGGYGPDNPVVTVDMSGKFPTMSFPDGFGSDISQYALVSTFSEKNSEDESELDAVRFDGRYDFSEQLADSMDASSVEFGYRYGKRKVTSENYDLVAPFTRALNDGSGDVLTSYAKWKDTGVSIDAGTGDTIGSYLGYSDLQNSGYIHSVSDFGPASTGESFFFIDPSTMVDAMAFQNAMYPGNYKAANWANSYIVEEKTHTFYVQGNTEGTLGLPYNLNVGFQFVQSELEVTSYRSGSTSYLDVDGERFNAISGAPGPLAAIDVTSRESFDVLPRVNLSVDLTEEQVLRFSYTKNLTQLDAQKLGAGQSITYTPYGTPELDGVFQAQQVSQSGNPDLDPWKSSNYELSYEWYFNDEGIINFGLYYLDLETQPATELSTIFDIPDTDGVVRNNGLEYNKPINKEGITLQGYEIGYRQAYDFLPGFLGGLGSNINYTWSDGDGGNTDFYGKEEIQEGVSEHQANFVLWYQKGDLQARIAYNYRSERYNGNGNPSGHTLSYYTAPTEYVDASINYQLNEHIELYVQGSNITEEFETSYMQWEDVKVNQNVFEARYTVGIRGKL